MVFEDILYEPPSGGALQYMRKISGCGMRIPYIYPSDSSNVIFSIWCVSDASGRIIINIGNNNTYVDVNTNWQRVYVQINSLVQSDEINIYVGDSINVIFYEAQLEVGNKITDWKEAPEDTQNGIDNAKNIADNAQNGVNNTRNIVNRIATQSNTTDQNLGKWFNFNDSRGLVIRAYNIDTGESVGIWENVISEDAYRINNINYGTVFEAYKDRVRPTKIELTKYNQSIVMKADGRGGMVWVKG